MKRKLTDVHSWPARPRIRRIAGSYSITSSARASSVGGTVRPSALAALRLITNSNLVGCSIGRSVGLAPLRILSTSPAARRDDLGRKMMRQVAGALADHKKGRLVAKLRSGRQPKRMETGKKVGGRMLSFVALAKRCRRASPKTGERLSYRDISVKLADAGYVNEHGQPFNAQSVRAMIEDPQPRQRS
jgi:hypothetical protein